MTLKCKTCGGPLKREGNYYVCEYCRNKWEIDSDNDFQAIDRANAWSALREGNFEKSTELFENILLKEPNNHEAHWGRALSRASITYVTDLNENKKVPTCNNITENSFIQDVDVRKAIEYAPTDIQVSYKQQADYIEKIRTEWLEQASKEPEYDVFISYKDSDRENGIERTQDSIDAQDLYNALIAEGYKVFFSRISLREKVSEQYEPYIYNAIKTAKVMIVFGEKAEYFNSVWVKNEWTRFKVRITSGEKHKNSLVVVYKNLNPNDLPAVLKSRQCLNAGDMTFFSDLNRHIKRVIDEATKNIHLDKIEISAGQIAKKATTLSIHSIETQKIGLGSISEVSISEKQTLGLIRTYLSEQQWEGAGNLIEDVLFSNPGCAEAIWCNLLTKYKVIKDEDICLKINEFNSEDFTNVEKFLNCANNDFAEIVLKVLYGCAENVSDESYCKVLRVILPFSFEKRVEYISTAFDNTIKSQKFLSFKLLLTTLQSNDVDKYIDYNYKFALSTNDINEKSECIKNILDVDEGNIKALHEKLIVDLLTLESVQLINSDLETLLKYSFNVNDEVTSILSWLEKNLSNKIQCEFSKQLIRYYTGHISSLKDYIKSLSKRMIDESYFDEAEYFVNVVLSFDENDIESYWNKCLIKTKSKSDNYILRSLIALNNIPEYRKYMSLVDDKTRKKCIQLEKAQQFMHTILRNQFSNSLMVNVLGHIFTLNINTLRLTCYSSNFTQLDKGDFYNFINPLLNEKVKKIYKVSDYEMCVVTCFEELFYILGRDQFQSFFVVKVNLPTEGLLDLYVQNDADKKFLIGSYSNETLKYTEIGTDNLFTSESKIPLEIKCKHGSQFFFSVLSGKIVHYGDDESSLYRNVLNNREKVVSVASIWGEVFKPHTKEKTHIYVLTSEGELRDENWAICSSENERFVQLLSIGNRYFFALRVDGTVYIHHYRGDGEESTKGVFDTIWMFTRLHDWKNINTLFTTYDPVEGFCHDNNRLIGLKNDGTWVFEGLRVKDFKLAESGIQLFKNSDNIFDEYNQSVQGLHLTQRTLNECKLEKKSKKSKQGCYIATCVYGSYNCPEVCMLRRFRDDVLKKTWYGRLFIRIYYSISPYLVQEFGQKSWFKLIWKDKLDKMVKNLKNKGFESSPYQDRSDV